MAHIEWSGGINQRPRGSSLPSQPVVNLASLQLRSFGSPALLVEQPGGEAQPLLPAGKPLLVLAYLVAHLDLGASRETLTTLGWGERDDSHAKASLRQTLYRLRQLLGRDALAEEGTAIRLTIAIASDWGAATRAVADGDDVALLATVRGRFLDGLDADDDAGSDWLATERMRWERQLREAALREGRRLLVAGQTDEAIGLAERALSAGADHLPTWTLYLDALTATEVVTRIEDGLARLEAAGAHGLLGATDSQGWRQLARRARRSLERGVPRTPAVATPTGTLPFTGRSAILAHLQQLLRLPPDEPRRIIAIVASAGFGKSRLLRELRLRQSGAAGIMVSVETRGSESTTIFALFNRVVEALAELPDALGVDPAEAAVLVAANPRLAGRFEGIEQTPRDVPTQAAMAKALGDLVSAVAEHQPLYLVVDDAQWGDHASIALLDAAFSGLGTGQAACLIATRDLTGAMPSHWHVLHLSSLTGDHITSLLASELSSLPSARHTDAAEALLLVTGGVPIYVMRALQRLNVLAADGVAGDALLGTIPTLVLHRDPAFPAGEVDRRVLGYLAIAGGMVGEEELGTLADVGSQAAVRDRLGQLERAGWVVHRGAGYQLSHDLVQQQAIEGLTPLEQRELALQHAQWLSLQGDGLHDLQRAVRVSLAHGAEAQAVRAVREWRRRVRGGPRGRALAALVLPPNAPRSTSWRLIAAATPTLRWRIAAICVTLGLGGWSALGWLGQPVMLAVENTPRVPPSAFYGDGGPLVRVMRNTLAPRFTVRNRFGQVTTALDGESLRVVGATPGVDSFRLWPSPVIRNGSVSAESLMVFKKEAEAYAMTFQAGTLTSPSITMFSGFAASALTLVGGELNGSRVMTDPPEVVVAPGDSLRGRVLLRYTTPAHAALWMLAESSTMLPLGSDTTTVITLYTGVTDALTEVIVRRRVPTTPGTYWLVWAFAAEPAAEWIFSLTNWRCATAHWNDGRDLLVVPDSVLAKVGAGGFLTGMRDLCNPEEPMKREKTIVASAVLKVVVK